MSREKTDGPSKPDSTGESVGLTRRSFLQSGAVGLSAAATASASARETVNEPARSLPITADVDVVVVGGGPGGVPAALAAARAGVKVMLVERYAFLGGHATADLMNCYNGFRNQRSPNATQTVKGIPAEIVNEIREVGGTTFDISYEQSTEGLGQSELPYAVGLDPEAVKYVLLKMLVDAGVELLLHAWGAGAVREGDRVTGVVFQSKSGRQAIRSKVVVDATGDGDIAADAGAESFQPDKSKLLGWSLMLRLANVDKAKLRGMPGILYKDSLVIWGPGIEGADGTDVRDLTRAEIKARLEVPAHVARRRKQPGFENAYLIDSATNIGVRETRHILGDHFLTGKEIIAGTRFPDVVAIGSNPIPGYREPSGRRRRFFLEHEGYDIPYRCLVPKKIDGMVVSGRCISADSRAAQSSRAMATCMAIGHAAGAAAALAVKNKVVPRKVSVSALQQLLLDQNAELRL